MKYLKQGNSFYVFKRYWYLFDLISLFFILPLSGCCELKVPVVVVGLYNTIYIYVFFSVGYKKAVSVTAISLKCMQIIRRELFLNPLKSRLLWATFIHCMCFQCLRGVTSDLSRPRVFLLWCYESKCHQGCLYSTGKVQQTRSQCVCVCVFSHTSAKADRARSMLSLCVCVPMRVSTCTARTTNTSRFRLSFRVRPSHLKVDMRGRIEIHECVTNCKHAYHLVLLSLLDPGVSTAIERHGTSSRQQTRF